MNENQAGWYPDPHDPTRQRWWDGSEWTINTHGGSGARSDGGLRPVGELVSESFRVVATDWRALILAAFALIVVPGAASTALVARLIDGALVTDPPGTGFDLEVSGVDRGVVLPLVVVGVVSILASLLFVQFVAARLLADERGELISAGDAFRVALRSMPAVIGVALLALAAVVVGFVFLFFLTIVGLPSIITLLALVAGLVWLGVRFFAAGIAAIDRRPAIATSGKVARRGGFWAVLGRLVLFALIGGGLTFAAGFVTSPVSRLSDEGTIARPSLDGDLEEDGEATIAARLDSPVDLIPSASSSIVSGAAAAVLAAGTMLMYRDTVDHQD